jgi:hypothetical protein
MKETREMKYEYKVLFVSAIGITPEEIEGELNKYGQKGWRLDKILTGTYQGGFLEDEQIYILILIRRENKSNKKGEVRNA